jgi:hypothetical protein
MEILEITLLVFAILTLLLGAASGSSSACSPAAGRR